MDKVRYNLVVSRHNPARSGMVIQWRSYRYMIQGHGRSVLWIHIQCIRIPILIGPNLNPDLHHSTGRIVI